MSKKILHIMKPEKFNVPFIDFLRENLSITNHKFIFLSKEKYEYGLTKNHSPIFIKNNFFRLFVELNNADQIILHGLWKNKFILLLFLSPWLLKKCYWVMWGGDFYPTEDIKGIKKYVIKKIAYFVTYIKGDYELIKKEFNANGDYFECLMYPSNLYKEYNLIEKKSTYINIQIGNSGFETNNHSEIFKKLIEYKNEDIKIYAPLSYGNKEYIENVIKEGKKLFGEKFIPITEFMNFDKYLEFLANIDIAIFAHDRQQAMGNIITLLGLGKKVYIRSDITPYQLFKNIDVNVLDIDDIQINLLDKQIKKENQQKIKEYFSQENYLKQLQNLFENK